MVLLLQNTGIAKNTVWLNHIVMFKSETCLHILRMENVCVTMSVKDVCAHFYQAEGKM